MPEAVSLMPMVFMSSKRSSRKFMLVSGIDG